MWAFYTVIPLFLVLLHFDVLQNVQEHRLKLNTWLASLPEAEQANAGNQLFPYILDFAQVRYGNVANPSYGAQLVAAGAWLMYVYLPMAVLATFFIRFADLQGVGTTLWHLFLLVVDYFVLVRTYWGKVHLHEKTDSNSKNWIRMVFKNFANVCLLCGVLWVFSFWNIIQYLHFQPYEKQTPFAALAMRKGLSLENWVHGYVFGIALIPRISVPQSRPFQVKEDDIRLEKWLNPRQENFVLWGKSAMSLDLSYRRLAYANFRDSQLQRVDLNFTDLQAADFTDANLSSAELKFANLQRTTLGGATFRGANLEGVDLRGSQLVSLGKNGIFIPFIFGFRSADFRGASLVRADFGTLDTSVSAFQGAYFHEKTQLNSINSIEAHKKERVKEQAKLFDLLCADFESHSGMLRWHVEVRFKKIKPCHISTENRVVSHTVSCQLRF